MRSLTAFTISVAVVLTLGGFALHSYSHPGTAPRLIPITPGTLIVINTSDKEMVGGAMITASSPRFYGLAYNIDVYGHYILNGSWKSTGLTLVYLFVNNRPYMATPVPDETSGQLNQTIWTGSYTLVIAGYPGDRILVTSSMGIHSYVPYRVGSFLIPGGTYIHSPETYSFDLNQSAILVGSFTVGGMYYYSLFGAGGGFSAASYNISAKPGLNTFSVTDSPPLSSGQYNFTFVGATFYVNQTMEFVLYYDNSR